MAKEKGNAKVEDVIRLQPEPVIQVAKSKIILKLVGLIEPPSERFEFLKLCKRVEYTIRAWYLLRFEDLMQLYSLFDPIHGNQRLEEQSLSDEEIDVLELNFLKSFFKMMEKSNFKLVTDEENELARSEQYLLNLPIEVDESKLDKKLLPKFYDVGKFYDVALKGSHVKLPAFKDKYIIFHRGRGIDHTTGFFFTEKLNMIIARTWTRFLEVTRLQRFLPSSQSVVSNTDTKKTDEIISDPEKESLVFTRKRIENMELSASELIGKVEIQEPTFDRIIVVYRRASTNEKIDRGIYIKHFKNIPMADMELVLPAKKNPSLTPTDWVNFVRNVILGLVTLVSSLEMPTADISVVLAILFALIVYCANIYFSFQQNLASYQNLIIKSMYDKQLDSGKGTLLHLCDDVIQQEVKEVIISYYILMKQGELGTKELDFQCEKLIKDEFGKQCKFEVEDAVKKLVKLGIVTQENGRIRHVNLKDANDIIGATTEELVAKAQQVDDESF